MLTFWFFITMQNEYSQYKACFITWLHTLILSLFCVFKRNKRINANRKKIFADVCASRLKQAIDQTHGLNQHKFKCFRQDPFTEKLHTYKNAHTYSFFCKKSKQKQCKQLALTILRRLGKINFNKKYQGKSKCKLPFRQEFKVSS